MRGTIRGALVAIAAVIGLAAAPAQAGSAKPLFASDDPIHISITAPMAKVRSDRAQGDSTDGTLTVISGGTAETLPIKLAARGITRRLTDTCSFPPLRVTFAQKPGAGSLFAGQSSLKLVTHCQPKADFENYVLLEYSAYRMYNLMTPLSFRARLATVDYVDAGGKPFITRPGFFLEDAGDIGKRNDLKRQKLGQRIQVVTLDPMASARFGVFEYMIGNLDWAQNAGPAGTDCCHNARLMGNSAGPGALTPVPYDFDFSGLVNAPYATPPEGINVPNVRTRLYRGFCRFNAQATAAMADFTAHQAQILGVLDAVPGLDPKAAARAKDYLGGFFTADPQKVITTCL